MLEISKPIEESIEEAVSEINGKRILYQLPQSPLKASEWAKENWKIIDAWLDKYGALLIRGLPISGSKQLSRVLSSCFNSPLVSYQYRSTPRTHMRENIYTSTEYHSSQHIPQHNENAYCNSWPTRIAFYCQQAPISGGETPIADCVAITKDIPETIKKKFQQKGLMYVRNYQDVDLPWAEVFQTTNKSEVESYCSNNDIHYEWLQDNGLRTRQVTPCFAYHPFSGQKLWFNQAHLFHVSQLPDDVQRQFIKILGKENLPRNVYHADGSDIDVSDLNIIREIYQRHQYKFSWQEGDLLLLDNMLYTHGRTPFNGNRKILTGMSKVLSRCK